MKRTIALAACAATAAGSFALTPAAQAEPKKPGIVRSGGAVAPVAAGELSASFTLRQTASQKAKTRALADKRGGDRSSFAATQPVASARDAVLGWAAAEGFRVLHSSRFLVTVAGPANELASALGTGVKKAGRYTVPVAPPAVPAQLRTHAESVVGVDDRPVFRHHAVFGPADVRAMGNNVVRDSTAGAGVTVGTVNFSGWYPDDLVAYADDPEGDGDDSKDLTISPGQITEVSVDGSSTFGDDGGGGSGEVALDAEAILAAAPAAKQRLYFGDNSAAGSLAIWDRMAADAQAGLLHVVSSSWGICESAYDGFPTALAAEAARIDSVVAAGATVFAASGDYGAYGCSSEEAVDNTLDVDFPSAHPRVVGVGGTTTDPGASPFTYTHKGWGPATVNTSPGFTEFQGVAAGGGYSTSFLTGPPGQPTTGTPGRRVPDIAALADPETGFIVNIDGIGVAGGTSLAAPLSAAGLAGVISKRSPIAGMGNILPTLYANPSVTRDVVGNGNGYYPASVGYDHVTGLGIMDWTAFAALLPTAIPAPTFTIPSHLRSTTFPVTVGGTPSHYTSWGMASASGADDHSAPSCNINTYSSAPTSYAIGANEGRHTVWLTALDVDGVCHAVSRTTFLDTQAPVVQGLKVVYSGTTTPKFTVSWALTDAAPSSGLAVSRLTLRDNTLGKVVYVKDTTTNSMVLNAVAGHSYTVTLNGYDRAGGTSAPAGKPFTAPTDDRAFSFSGFTRQNNTQDYMGSHAVASRAGNYATFTFTGKLAWVGIIKSRSCGYMDVYVDGARKARVNLYSSATQFRQQLRVATFSTVGTHTVVLRPVGTHQPGSTGNNVYVDSLTVA